MSDGVAVHLSDYPTDGSDRPVILSTHGLQSHAGWYEWSGRFLQSRGYPVWFFDRRGSGRSDGPRGHVRSADRLLADVRAIRRLAAEETGRPVVLMGVCWAAKLLAASAAESPDGLAAVVLAYPAFRTRFDPSLRQRLLLSLAGWAGISRRPVLSPLRPEHFTDNMAARRFIADDPLATRTLSVEMARADRELSQRLDSSLRSLQVSTRVVLCGRDRIVRPESVRRLMTAAVPHASIQTEPSAAHVLEFEPDRERIYSAIADWLDETTHGVGKTDR